jgi:hypothetical protein
MNSVSLRKVNNEIIFFVFILICSAGIRFFQLGKNPLNDSEARLALSALNLIKGQNSDLIAQPLYLAFTSLFFVFSASNFTARLLPALIGSVFPLTPLFYKRWIGSKAAVILCTLLTFDPLLISISRQADSRILALFLLITFIVLVFKSSSMLAGIIAGLFILSGVYAWHLSIILVFSIIAFRALIKNQKRLDLKKHFTEFPDNGYGLFIFGLLICLIFVGTGFLKQPILINGLMKNIFEFYASWLNAVYLFNKIGFLLIIFASSYLFLFIFNIIGLVTSFKELGKNDKFFCLYLGLSFLYLFGNPSSTAADLYLFIAPFYYFVMKGILSWWNIFQKNKSASLIISVPIICLLGFIWLAILRILLFPIGGIDYAQMLIAIIGSVFLLGLIFLLISWGWSLQAAFSGLSLGLLLVLALFQLSVSFHSLGISERPESEIWWNSQFISGSTFISNTIEEISLWNNGFRNGIDVQIQGVNSPALVWLLRNQIVTEVDNNSIVSNPSIVFSASKNSQLLESAYRGQKIAFYASPMWMQNIPQSLDTLDFYRWLFLRDGIIQKSEIFLWARAELFIGNNIKFESKIQS